MIYTINCVCHSIRSMFRVLVIYNFGFFWLFFYNFMTFFIPGKNHFDVIPNGWVVVEHISGMPIYLHRQSRSISVTRPYHLGPASARVSYLIYTETHRIQGVPTCSAHVNNLKIDFCINLSKSLAN